MAGRAVEAPGADPGSPACQKSLHHSVRLETSVRMEGIISTPLHHVPGNKPNLFIAEILKIIIMLGET